MNIIADTHTHTIASTHAYSTILENAKFASVNGIQYLAMTDHAPALCDAPHIWHFANMSAIPDFLYEVRILKGAEVNILANGELDMSDDDLSKLEWVNASIHRPTYKKTSIEENTKAYIKVAKNPYVDVIAHSGYENYMYDYEKAIKVFKEYNKLVEINNHSFESRVDSIKNCIEIAKVCKKYGVRVVVNSDAHFAYSIGNVENALNMLKEIDFPEKLIVNSDVKLFESYLKERKARVNI